MDDDIKDLLDRLDYLDSQDCLFDDRLANAPGYGHVFRRATGVFAGDETPKSARLNAVYCIRSSSFTRERPAFQDSLIPAVYVCKAQDAKEAAKIHRLVWNQSVAPLVLVLCQDKVRLFSGFAFGSNDSKGPEVPLSAIDALRISAEHIANGETWHVHSGLIRPDQRVEWRLLENLRGLRDSIANLSAEMRPTIHALIGKFLYLHYLRARNILSSQWLEKRNIEWSRFTSPSLSPKEFFDLTKHVDEFLNGTMFPIKRSDLSHTVVKGAVGRIANVFAGNDPGGQQHFEFDNYDFSYIPIETLSVIYEQFLHDRPFIGGESEGKKTAAYYTPIPVVNFIIDRMDEVSELDSSSRVLDPACGSGAFLVQCYRRLVERQRAKSGVVPGPVALRALLQKCIFGIDINRDACRVTELSLNLTLLDYVSPPDLTSTPFKLPELFGKNIIHGDAFALHLSGRGKSEATSGRYDWVIGNPPWKELRADGDHDLDRPAMDWISGHKEECPVNLNQSAQAFAWLSARDFASPGGSVGLLLPGTTLLGEKMESFRRGYFTANTLRYVANFSNLVSVLFKRPGPSEGQAHHSAAAIVVTTGKPKVDDWFPVFSPLLANQELTRAARENYVGNTAPLWSLTVNEGEVRYQRAKNSRLALAATWKQATWGNGIDERLLQRMLERPVLENLLQLTGLMASQGLETRERGSNEPVESAPQLVGALTLEAGLSDARDRVLTFPNAWLSRLPASKTYVRAGRVVHPLSVCEAPHIVVSASRSWAVYEDRFIVVPARQIGIAGTQSQAALLKAVAFYLNSDAAWYLEFFLSGLGEQRNRATLRSLKQLPIPQSLMDPQSETVQKWATMYEFIRLRVGSRPLNKGVGFELHNELNRMVHEELGLNSLESIRVRDVAGVYPSLFEGGTGGPACGFPDNEDIRAYSEVLRKQIQSFVGKDGDSARYDVTFWHDDAIGMARFAKTGVGSRNSIASHDHLSSLLDAARDLKAVLRKHQHWYYNNRSLRVFADDAVYLFKPMQKLHWLRSQAAVDAREIVALAIQERSSRV